MKTKVTLKRSVERYQEMQQRIREEVEKLRKEKETSAARGTKVSNSAS